MVFFELACEHDAEILKEIGKKAFEDDKKEYGSIPSGMDSVAWHLSQIKGGMYYKIVKDGRIIGGIRIFDMKNRHYHLGSIYIHPDFQNCGIGHKAIDFIEKEYPYVQKWSLDTPYKSYRNHCFYEKHGYVKVGETKPEKENGLYLFLYEKSIKP
jgi:GNAT superfamily N-acetyltransferase